MECDEPAARAAILDRECTTDPELRRRVEGLLSAYDQAGSLVDRPTVGPAGGGIVAGTLPKDNQLLATGAGDAPSVMTSRASPGYEILGELVPVQN